MRPFERAPEPLCLVENAARWNQAWQELRSQNPSAKFKWADFEGRPVNQYLIDPLAHQTQHHCSYCDCCEIGRNEESIDHFRPKSDPSFYHLAYAWSNLYYACWNCQNSKKRNWSDDAPPLAPDEQGYSFEYYFIYNALTGEIDPNPMRSEYEQARAKNTIETFGLKDPQKHCKGRIRAMKSRQNPAFDPSDLPYRYIPN